MRLRVKEGSPRVVLQNSAVSLSLFFRMSENRVFYYFFYSVYLEYGLFCEHDLCNLFYIIIKRRWHVLVLHGDLLLPFFRNKWKQFQKMWQKLRSWISCEKIFGKNLNNFLWSFCWFTVNLKTFDGISRYQLKTLCLGTLTPNLKKTTHRVKRRSRFMFLLYLPVSDYWSQICINALIAMQ